MDAILEWLECLSKQLFGDGFGDPDKSQAGSQATGAAWVEVLNHVSNPCCLWLRVTGANEVEVTTQKNPGPGDVGFPLPVSTPVANDRFKGRLYARSSAGASTLAWWIEARNVTD